MEIEKKVTEFLEFLNLPQDILTIHQPYDTIEDYKSQKEWGSANLSGVYAFYSDSKELLYIGESVNIGGRLSSYFKYAHDGAGRAISPKSKGVRWVVIIGFTDDYWFMAPSLEHYLIYELKPKRNHTLKD